MEISHLFSLILSCIVLCPCDIMSVKQSIVCERTVICVSVRERILAIRLMEKLQANPAHAKALGIEVGNKRLPVGSNEKREE